jgi:hypothetical protein
MEKPELKKEKDTTHKKEEKPTRQRKSLPDEERAKRGRWVILFVLLASIMLSYFFSLGSRH